LKFGNAKDCAPFGSAIVIFKRERTPYFKTFKPKK